MGIAAVQIGIPVRLVLLRRRHGETGDLFQPFFNPHISHQSRRQIASWENCLSVPWGYRFTLRPERIRIRYQSDTGITQRETLYGEEAVVFQQETDHLDGKLLNHHYSKAWFIPNNEIEEFARDSSRQCQNLFRQQCNRQMKSLWKSRAKSEAKPR
jgi:peptide deformylase